MRFCIRQHGYGIRIGACSTGLGICQKVMEILGIVWAASIIYPASAIAKSAQEFLTSSPQQYETLLSHEPREGWRSRQLNSRRPAAWWPKTHTAVPHQFAAPEARVAWGAFLPLGLLSGQRDRLSQQESFQTLVPAIGNALTSFEPPADVSPAASAATRTAEPALFDDEWHSWSAVAAVRVEESAVGLPAPASPPQNQPRCLQAAQASYQPSALALKASPKTQIWVHNQFIGEVSGQVVAQKIATKLRTLAQSGKLDPTHLRLLVGQNFVGISYQNDLLFLVDETLQPHPEVPATVTAAQWVNNLRTAFDEAPLGTAEIQMAVEGLQESTETIYGTASWYGPRFHGRKTANGEIFDENALTAAHKTLPFNTQLKVTNRLNGRSVVVRINDRGPYIGQRSLDLSKAAAHCLGSTVNGVVPYEAVILEAVQKPKLDELATARLTVD